MKCYGDISPQDLKLVSELEEMERYFHKNRSDFPNSLLAKTMTCMAHDYYFMSMEEQGDRLLCLAEKYSSGYFKETIHTHAVEDPDFSFLVSNLITSMGFDTMKALGYRN